MRKRPSMLCDVLIIAALAVVLVCLALPASAATWYVNWNTGSDSYNGSSTTVGTGNVGPWKNINAGDRLGLVRAGDTVQVAAGTYQPESSGYAFTLGGDPGFPVVYHANGHVVIDGQGAVQSTVVLTGTCSIVFDGFEFANCTVAGIDARGGQYNYEVKNCSFHDFGPDASVEAYGIKLVSGGGWLIHNNVFYNSKSTHYLSAAIYVDNCATDWIEIYNNSFYKPGGADVMHNASSIVEHKNNISTESSYVGYNWWHRTLSGGLDSDYNDFFHYNNAPYAGDWAYGPYPAANDISADPLYVNPSIGNLHLKAGSPCINAGVDTLAGLSGLPGVPAKVGDHTDMGAFEYDGTATSAVVTGTVTNAVTHAPIANATISVPGETDITPVTTNGSGIYTLSLTYGGPHQLQCTAPNYFAPPAIAYTANGSTVTQNFSMSPPGTLQGVVTWNKTGNPPLAGVTVTVVGTGVSGTTVADGSYLLTSPSGAQTVSVSFPGFIAETEDVTISAGGTLTRNYSLTIIPGKDYYVDGSAPYGYNGTKPVHEEGTNNGPWQYIAQGDSDGVLKPGDVVHVAAGTYLRPGGYTYQVDIEKCAGSAYAPIVYKADPGAKIIGDGTAPQWAFYVHAAYNVIDGFEISNTNTGVDFAANGCVARNNYIHDQVARGYLPKASGFMVDAANATMHNNLVVNIGSTADDSAAVCFYFGGEGAKVYNNTFVNCGNITGGHNGNQNYNVTTNNVIFHMKGVALTNAGWGGVTSSHNIFYDCPAGYYTGTPSIGGDLVMDPMLDANYKPVTGSPCINTGVDLGIDHNGSAPGNFNGSAPDRGWFETDSTAVPTVAWIDGVVYDAVSNTPITGATVAVSGGPTATTDTSGIYSASPVTAGTQTVTASASGYATQSASVTLPGSGGNPGVTKNFYLVPASATEVTSLRALKNLTSPTAVVMTLPKKVTMSKSNTPTYSGGFWIEEPDRTAGMYVWPKTGLSFDVAEGDSICLAGTILPADPASADSIGTTEPTFNFGSIISQASGTPLVRLGMTNKSFDTNKAGLLTTVWGKIRSVGGLFYVDDGSGVDDGTGNATGIRVLPGSVVVPTTGFVVVTGEARLILNGSAAIPAIQPRAQKDVVSF